MSDTEKIWVYGSLLTGFFNYEKALRGKILSTQRARVQGIVYHQEKKGYPALVPGTGWAYGQLFTIEDAESLFCILDDLEGFHGTGATDNEYERKETEIFVEQDGRWHKEMAFVYWYARTDLGSKNNPVILLEDGDWKAYMQEHESS